MDPNNFQPNQPPQQPIEPQQQAIVDAVYGQQPQVVQPSQPQSFTPTMPNDVNVNASPQNNPQVQPGTDQPVVVSDGKKKPKLLLIFGVILGVFVVIVIVALIFGRPKKKAASTSNTQQTQQTQNQGPQPAQAIDVEQSNNSINQDISSINTETDFPTTQLSDKSLGL